MGVNTFGKETTLLFDTASTTVAHLDTLRENEDDSNRIDLENQGDAGDCSTRDYIE